MWNVPTDLLRTLIAVIDHRGYTRAGAQVGRAQSTISLQIKRLQDILNTPLFEKDSGGVTLTEAGKLTASYARRILALNDELLVKLSAREGVGRLRIGLPNDFADRLLPPVMASFAKDNDGVSFEVVCDLSHALLERLREDLFDLVIAMTPDGPADGAFMSWREPLSWVGGEQARIEPGAPLRLVCYPEGCLYRESMLSAIARQGLPFDIVYTSPSLAGLEAAVAANFGITLLATRTAPPHLKRLADPALPVLPPLVSGIYLRDGDRQPQARQLAARFAAQLSDAPA